MSYMIKQKFENLNSPEGLQQSVKNLNKSKPRLLVPLWLQKIKCPAELVSASYQLGIILAFR